MRTVGAVVLVLATAHTALSQTADRRRRRGQSRGQGKRLLQLGEQEKILEQDPKNIGR